MTKPFVLEFGSDGIRVNAVLPGLFATSLADAFTPEQKLKATQKTSLERLWRPEEIDHAVLFLASGTARHVTGTSPVVDGDRAISNQIGKILDMFSSDLASSKNIMPGYVGDLDCRTHRHLTYPPHQGPPKQRIKSSE